MKERSTNKRKMCWLILLSIAAALIYLFLFMNMKYFDYFMSLRVPKLVVMIIVAFAIGGASIVFQSIINNTIVTPCLLGMNSLIRDPYSGCLFSWFRQYLCGSGKSVFWFRSDPDGRYCDADLQLSV